jgi:hypothetical protein
MPDDARPCTHLIEYFTCFTRVDGSMMIERDTKHKDISAWIAEAAQAPVRLTAWHIPYAELEIACHRIVVIGIGIVALWCWNHLTFRVRSRTKPGYGAWGTYDRSFDAALYIHLR